MVWIYHFIFIYSSVDGCLGCFHFLAIKNNIATNICVEVLCGHASQVYTNATSLFVTPTLEDLNEEFS